MIAPIIEHITIVIIIPKIPKSFLVIEFATSTDTNAPENPITPSNDKSILPINKTKVIPVANTKGIDI